MQLLAKLKFIIKQFRNSIYTILSFVLDTTKSKERSVFFVLLCDMKRIVALIFLLTLLTATVGFSQTDDRAAFDESLIKTITDLVPDTDNLTDNQVDSLEAIVKRWGFEKYHNKTLQPQYVQNTPTGVAFLELPYDSLDINTFHFGYRLLGVARFWNIIEYYAPNRDLTDTPWSQVLRPYIVKAADRNISTEALFADLVHNLDDSHARTHYSSLAGPNILPIVASFAENRMIVTDTCSLAGSSFQPGDEILAINGEHPTQKLPYIASHNSFSNRETLLCYGSYLCLYTPEKEATVTYLPKGSRKTVTFQMPTVQGSIFMPYISRKIMPTDREPLQMLSDSVAYIHTGSLNAKNCDAIYTKIEHTKKLIVDIRTYPEEFRMMWDFFGFYFVENPTTFVKFTQPIAEKPQQFTSFTLENTEDPSPNPDAYKGQIIVLVNAQTISMAEYFTMLLQSIPGTITLGSQTAGADGNVTKIYLPYNYDFSITGLGVSYPDGRNAQRNGVHIDIEVKPTAQGLIDGRDELLEAAIKF